MPGRITSAAKIGRGAVLVAALFLTAAAVDARPGAAQDLPLKREIPGEAVFQCAPLRDDVEVGVEERSEATRLGSSASQALILGDRARARDLLARATQIDPSSAELAYQYARVLEELSETDQATAEYCRVIALRPTGAETDDARDRLDALTVGLQSSVSETAKTAFRDGLGFADTGRFDLAMGAFDTAILEAPSWSTAHYNHGVAAAGAGERQAALESLQRYLDLEPAAPDALAVSQQMGQLQVVPTALPSPGAALGLGLIPGMGQLYSGRPGTGLTFLSLAAGAAITGFMVEDVEVLCLTEEDANGECPSGQILSETSEKPFLMAGLGAAAAITVVGAIEAFVKAKGRRGATTTSGVQDEGNPVTVLGPSILRQAGSRVEIRIVGLAFRE